MSISSVGSGAGAMPLPQAVENEAAERVPDNEAAEARPPISLKEGTGTKIDLSV